MSRITLTLICALLFSFLHLDAQDKKREDSLLNELRTAEDTSRVLVLNDLAYVNRIKDPDAAIKYADESIALAEKLHFENGRFDAYMKKGLVYYNTGQRDSSLKYFQISREIADEIGDPSQQSAIYSNLGNVYGDIGQNKQCLWYYRKSAEFAERTDRKFQRAYLQVNIGTIYSALEQHDSALVFYNSGLELLLELDPDNENLYIIYGNIGSSYIQLGDTVKAEEAYLESMRLGIKFNNQRALAASYDHLAIIEYSKGHTDTALSYFRKAIALNYEIEARQGLSESCLHLGNTFAEMHEYDSATYYLKTGMKIAEEIQDYYSLDDYYKILSSVYESTGKTDSALLYYKKLENVRDTLFNMNKSNIVGEMRTELENERRSREIDVLKEQDEKKNVIIYASLALGILLLLLGILAFNRYLVKKRSAALLEKQNAEIQEQKEIIEEKNKDITDSIRYAKRIQNAILPSDDRIRELFKESWSCFLPKDIVSGDFYWFEQSGEYKLFGVVDCTGHGVPGALLSVVGHNLLDKALSDLKLIMPDKILEFLDAEIHKTLRHKDASDETGVHDGMDIALCCYHEKSGKVYYSGAFNPMYIIRQGELIEFKANKILIGSGASKNKPFDLHVADVKRGDEIVLFSDGFADQFGGPFGKKLKYKPFKELLLSVHQQSMSSQATFIRKSFEEWRKDYDQVDDVCVVAVRI